MEKRREQNSCIHGWNGVENTRLQKHCVHCWHIIFITDIQFSLIDIVLIMDTQLSQATLKLLVLLNTNALKYKNGHLD